MILLRLYLLAGLIAHEAVETLEALNAIRSGAKRTWLLCTLLPVLQSVYPEIMTSIQHDFKVVRQFKGALAGGAIFVCRSIYLLSSPRKPHGLTIKLLWYSV